MISHALTNGFAPAAYGRHASSNRDWLGVLCSILFAWLIMAGPWEAIRGDEFADLVNYRTRIYTLHDYGMRYFVWEDSLLGWLRYEFLWFRLLAFVAEYNIHPNTFIASIVGISAFTTHCFLRKYLGVFIATLILLNPITIDLLSSQIRSAFAFALFLAVVMMRPSGPFRYARYGLLLPLPFIHTGLLLMIGLYAGSVILANTQRFSAHLKVAATIIGAVGLAAAIIILLPSVVEATEDRRNITQYGLKSKAYLSFWIACAGALIISINSELARRWEYFFALTICVAAPLLELAGLPGFRFVALGIPVIFAALAGLRGVVLHSVIFATACYQFLLILYWIQ